MADEVKAQAIVAALRAIGQAQFEVYRQAPRNLLSIGINRATWRRIDWASRFWRRDVEPDPYIMDPTGLSIADMVWVAIAEGHRVTRMRDVVKGGWCQLAEDAGVPDDMLALVYDHSPFSGRTAARMLDLTPLLQLTPPLPAS